MPFWSRKGKEKARDQDTIVPRSRSSDSIDSELAKPEYQKATPDEKPNLTRQKLVAYWETEEERLSQIALKVEEAQGKCSPAYMAATEAADEALEMSLEVSARAEEGHYSILSDAEDAEILKVYEETGKGIVPDKVLQSVLDTMIHMHADCCCSHINRDRPYPSKQFKGRSFRGDNPIPVHKNDKPVPQSTQKLEKENDESFTDDADSDSYDPSKSPEEDYEALPSYGEAIAQAQGKSQ